MEDTYTFIGAELDGRVLFMDIACLGSEAGAILHANGLMDWHAGGALVEIWRGAGLVSRVPRPEPG